LWLLSLWAQPCDAAAQSSGSSTPKPTEAGAKVILDTDIGDDIDDAFALGLALVSPEVQVVGIETAWGDTHLRAALVERLLTETGRSGIPVAEGIGTQSKTAFSQAAWARGGPVNTKHPQAVDWLLQWIRENPGDLTLVAIGPLTNLGAAIDKDATTFRKLKRVVLMGGSIRRRYGDMGYAPDRGPEPEYNIVCDIRAAQKLFTSGVPIFMMPLDSTQLKLDEVKRQIVFGAGMPLTNAVAALYYQWGQPTPTLFDVMAVAYAIDPNLCPVQPMHIDVDKDGYTRRSNGPVNASVCLDSDSEKFFRFLIPRLTARQN
jgi:inosine-uridine nucleoside N-ribohydrolase